MADYQNGYGQMRANNDSNVAESEAKSGISNETESLQPTMGPFSGTVAFHTQLVQSFEP